MKYKLLLLAFLFQCLFLNSILADDGMWLPHQMKMLNLQNEGLQMNPDDLFKEDGTGLMSAVVHLGGGTGEFVSKKGLILTNHHVAFGAIQRASSTENDYITNGFLAREKSLEIPAQGYIANVLLGYEDVTAIILSKLKPKMSYAERYKAIDQIKKKLIAKAEKESTDLKAQVKSMYNGNKYYLFRFKHLKDIRLVYAPPRDIGNYGGNIDNWMWPRHTCDFAFLRAYVSKEGKGTAYHKDNVPYQPKSVMKISLDGLKEGDFTFVMGYPGRTYRNYTLGEVEMSLDELKYKLDEYLANIKFLEAEGAKNRQTEIKYARTVKGMHNATKNYTGKLEGFANINLIEKKKTQQTAVYKWIHSNPELTKKYGNALADFEHFLVNYKKWANKNSLIGNLVKSRFGSTLLEQAHFIYRASVERQKKDIDREKAFQDRIWEDQKRKNGLVETGYDFATDRKFLKFRFGRLANKPKEDLPMALQKVFANNSIEIFVDGLYDHTILADPEQRQALLDMSPEQLQQLNDPLINLAAELENELMRIREERKAINQEYQDLKKRYMAAVLEMNENRLAPDANSTIRFTYGHIEGYKPADAIYYKPFTTLKGVMEKETGSFPFRVPGKLKNLYQNKDFGRFKDEKVNDIVTCFLNTTNVTGGNSGSATLNAKGEQVGIIFDMTYESVTGDYYVIPELQRTISVDIRYVLFITEKFSGAGFLLKEMGL